MSAGNSIKDGSANIPAPIAGADTPPLPHHRCPLLTVKHVPQVCAALAARDLRAHHTVADVCGLARGAGGDELAAGR